MLTPITETFGIDLSEIREYEYQENGDYFPERFARLKIYWKGISGCDEYEDKDADLIFAKIKEYEELCNLTHITIPMQEKAGVMDL